MNQNTPRSIPPQRRTVNTAAAGSTVGIQANEVHNSNVYVLSPDATPEEKYKMGVRYLADGVPVRAEELISEAITAGHDNAEVRFHWVLALLSTRSYRDLDRGERERLNYVFEDIHAYAAGEYRTALEAIKEIILHLNGSGGAIDTAEKTILELRLELRAKINRHLHLVLRGSLKDKLWAETKEQAEADRFSYDRLDRVWAYFHPRPIGARAREPRPEPTSTAEIARAGGGLLALTLAVGYLGWIILSAVNIQAILAYLLALATSYTGIRAAFDWGYRADRLRAKDQLYLGAPTANRSGADGFANDVSNSFKRYFGKYRPNGVDRSQWLFATAGIRGHLRDEIAEIYREQAVKIGEVNWLIGYLAQDVRRKWRNGTLQDYLTHYHVTRSTKVKCMLSLTTLSVAMIFVVSEAAHNAPITAWIAIITTAISAPLTAKLLHRIDNRRRRYRDEYEEYERNLKERKAAYTRWKIRLDETRPSEHEMQAWLQCDKTMLADEALRHYRLSWRDVIAHAMFQAPAKGYARHRVRRGPWRFSRYDLRLFLITEDGVREVISELDFEHAEFNGQERNNFRFDAVSSVNVAERSDTSRILKLTLTNGPTRNITVTDGATMDDDSVLTQDEFLRINLSAAGFIHALRILEGIAAEGKSWIKRDDHIRADA